MKGMKGSKNVWLVLACALVMLAVPSCSSDDEVVGVPPEQVVAAALNDALTTTVVPLVSFMGAIGDLMGGAPLAAPAGIGCPDTSNWCSSGSVVCTNVSSSLQFDFDQCVTVSGDGPITLDGVINAVPSPPTVYLTLTNFFINNSPAMSGNGTINTSSCDYTVNIATADAGVVGNVVKCDADVYPTGDVLTISFADFQIQIVFNGASSAPATATATQSGNVVAYCTINLAANPYSSTCSAP